MGYIRKLELNSMTSKELPNVYKSCPKMKDFDTFKKLLKTVKVNEA